MTRMMMSEGGWVKRDLLDPGNRFPRIVHMMGLVPMGMGEGWQRGRGACWRCGGHDGLVGEAGGR